MRSKLEKAIRGKSKGETRGRVAKVEAKKKVSPRYLKRVYWVDVEGKGLRKRPPGPVFKEKTTKKDWTKSVFL